METKTVREFLNMLPQDESSYSLLPEGLIEERARNGIVPLELNLMEYAMMCAYPGFMECECYDLMNAIAIAMSMRRGYQEKQYWKNLAEKL